MLLSSAQRAAVLRPVSAFAGIADPAPRSMAWEGRPLGEICRQISDPARDGGKSLTWIASGARCPAA